MVADNFFGYLLSQRFSHHAPAQRYAGGFGTNGTVRRTQVNFNQVDRCFHRKLHIIQTAPRIRRFCTCNILLNS